jgi:hypothetical protein
LLRWQRSYGADKEENVTEATQKRGAFSFLKDLVVEEVPDKPVPRTTPLPPSPIPQTYSNAPHAGIPDPHALAKLEARLQSSCPAPYASFMEQYETLKDVIPDETVRFKAALKTSHTNPDQILSALDQLLTSMKTALEEFTHSFEENKAKKLGESQQSIDQTDALIKSSEEQIKTVQEKIVSLKTKRETDAQNLHSEELRLESIRDGFGMAHAQIIHRLATQRDRIATMPKV